MFPSVEANTKLRGEGRLDETKVILGWLVGCSKYMVKLPDNKYKIFRVATDFINSKLTAFKDN